MSNLVEYRGITGTCIYSDIDEMYFGKVVLGGETKKFDGLTKEQAEINFQKLITKYLKNKNS